MPGPQVKRWDVYEALRREGATKEKAARIANSRRKRGSGRHQRPAKHDGRSKH